MEGEEHEEDDDGERYDEVVDRRSSDCHSLDRRNDGYGGCEESI